jgi:hypothetical protein
VALVESVYVGLRGSEAWIYLRAIDNSEIIDRVHERPASMISAINGLRTLEVSTPGVGLRLSASRRPSV